MGRRVPGASDPSITPLSSRLQQDKASLKQWELFWCPPWANGESANQLLFLSDAAPFVFCYTLALKSDGALLSNADPLDSLPFAPPPFQGTATPWDLPGRYTVTLPLETADPVLPHAAGYAAITINRLGVARVVGKLGDGTPISVEGPVDATRQLPFYSGLYGKKSAGKGSIFGMISFQTAASVPQCSGLLYWHKPAQPADQLYPSGFTTTLQVDGGPYSPSAPALALQSTQPNANISISGGNLLAAMDKTLAVSSSYKVRVMNPAADRLAVHVIPSTGPFFRQFPRHNT